MCDEPISPSELHTIVCSVCENSPRSDARSGAFLALINRHVATDSRPLSDLAEQLGISRRQLGRILSGLRPMRLAELRALTDLLGIDRARATVAIEILEDWQTYDDPALIILLWLIKPAFTKIEERSDFPLEPLADGAEHILTDWLADTIVANEKDMRHRRNDFLLPHKL